jgi:hypothetical protein
MLRKLGPASERGAGTLAASCYWAGREYLLGSRKMARSRDSRHGPEAARGPG